MNIETNSSKAMTKSSKKSIITRLDLSQESKEGLSPGTKCDHSNMLKEQSHMISINTGGKSHIRFIKKKTKKQQQKQKQTRLEVDYLVLSPVTKLRQHLT